MNWQTISNSNFGREQDRENHHTYYQIEKAVVVRP